MLHRYLLTLLFTLALAAPAWAQDAEPDADASEEAQSEVDEKDDSDLDDQNYAGSEDDDFVPSEDIPADQSIAFPTDI